MDWLLDAGLAGDRLHDVLDHTHAVGSRPVRLEEGAPGSPVEVDLELLAQVLREERQPILAALALPDADRPLGKVHVGDLEADQLADPEANLKQEAEDHPVLGLLLVGLGEDAPELLGSQDFRKPAGR